MDKVDQSRINNQPSDPPPSDYLTVEEAAALLEVKRETLYAYVSRGLLRGVPSGRGRSRLYLRADVERLRARSDARAGHGAVAAGALRWGEPVLESALTGIGPRGLVYRGHEVAALARADTPFEAVAELLWTGALPPERPAWEPPPAPPIKKMAALLPEGAHPFTSLAVAAAALGARDPDRHAPSGKQGEAASPAERARARVLVGTLAALIGLGRDAEAARAALAEATVARRVLRALGKLSERPAREAERAVDRALVISADHELNASAFAVRVAASAGADLYACMSAGVAALSGPLHGGACDRFEALLAEAGKPERAATVLRARLSRGEEIAGFGHPLYPEGDPRAVVLIETAQAIGARSARLATVAALMEAARAAGLPPPTLDVGLGAIAAALGLPPGSASALFAVGRTAGWIAHAFEQRDAGFMLRPRARYTGPGAT